MTKTFLKLILPILVIVSCGEQADKTADEQIHTKCLEVSFADIKGWQQDNFSQAYQAFTLTCQRLKDTKTEFLGEAEIKINVKDYLHACEKLPQDKHKFKNFLETNFVPCLVSYDGSSEGKFTSYYEAKIKASFSETAEYNVPIYGRPYDLIEFNPQDFDEKLPSQRLVGRIKNNKLIPYADRAEIEDKGINAPVILWANDEVDVYVMQIQGSAVAILDDGSKRRIGYADTNGRKFRGIGSILLENKLIKPGQASMGNIKKWLKENLSTAKKYLNQNQRFVFHRLNDADGPLGALGIPLTAGRSLAVDKTYIPLGALIWLETIGPNKEPIEKLVVAQDIGGAIKGAVRGDYFWGSGGDDILELAGKMNSKGRYFVLMPKKER